jgi:hypothetical protein
MGQQRKIGNSDNSQTAVEMLVEKLNQCEPMYSGIQSNEHKQYLDELIIQARKIEKSQIINAYLQNRSKGDIVKCLKTWDDAEQYYNETYKK